MYFINFGNKVVKYTSWYSVKLTLAHCSVVATIIVCNTMSARLLREEGSLSEATPPPLILTRRFYWSPRMMCLTTKPAIVILLWVFVVACVSQGMQYSGPLGILIMEHSHFQPHKYSFIYMICYYAFMAIIAVSYPIGGFIADVYLSRYKVVTICLWIIWTATFLLGIALIITLILDSHGLQDKSIRTDLNLVRNILLGLCFITVIPGLAGFYSNMTQLSLNQLQDAPSHTLGIFLHWCVWVDLLGECVESIIFFLLSSNCLNDSADQPGKIIENTGYVMTSLVLIFLTFLLILNCFTKRWYYAADIRYNPYKMVLDVLKYVRTHKYPTRHSAMHWTNGEQPSRFDFAKDCYGGPFTSSQVEDVKTLGRVVLVLLAVGPVFVLCVPTSYLVFFLFSFHVMGRSEEHCSTEWIFVKSGTLSYLLGLVSLPIITWVVYCVLKNRVPRILTRLEIGIVLYILGVLSMLIIDVVGHSVTIDTANTTQYLFLERYEGENNNPFFFFKFPWYVLAIPNCFSIISYSLILVTLLEFISAQAPQPMKGLIFGVFFAIKGIFVFISAAFLIPFSLKFSIIATSSDVHCGTSYFFLTLMVSLVGLVLFACVKRRYKYRVRDEEPFSQAVVEEIFERRLQQEAEENQLESPDIVPGSSEGRSSVSVRRTARVTESEEERVRASEWFVANGEGELRVREQDSLLSLSHDWYGTFKYDDS